MATKAETLRRTVDIQVTKASKVQGNYGPQWEIEAKVPYSQYPDRFWFDREESDAEIEAGVYHCILERGKNKNPDKYDGGADWHYQWKMIDFPFDRPIEDVSTVMAPTLNDSIPARSTEASSFRSPPKPSWDEQPMRPDHPSKRRSIERQGALKAAIDYVGLYSGNNPGDFDALIKLAEDFYAWISEGSSRPQNAPVLTADTALALNTAPTAAQRPQKPKATVDVDVIIFKENLPVLVSAQEFRRQCEARGWDRNYVVQLLGGKTPSEWVGVMPNRSYRMALIRCIDEDAETSGQVVAGIEGEADA